MLSELPLLSASVAIPFKCLIISENVPVKQEDELGI